MAKNILDTILEAKRHEVATRKKETLQAVLEARAREARPRGFFDALSAPGPRGANIIAEVKRASPSKGDLFPDCDPAALAKSYQKGGAAALSVLTDEQFFKGSEKDLALAREAVSLPVLRKDFIVSLYQVYETAAMGADAMLLIVAALSDSFMADALALARSLGLDVLVEVHSEEEMERAINLGARLVGVNNRDLTTFVTDIRTTARLAEMLPPDRVAVCESGIRTREDVVQILEAGVFNFLIGETLVVSRGPEAKLNELLGGEG